ncbi:unnamed protein product, partial [Menidia menidia]
MSTAAPGSQEGFHGLYNQGATCYLNSVLQVLFMTRDFREALHRFVISGSSLHDGFLPLKALKEGLEESVQRPIISTLKAEMNLHPEVLTLLLKRFKFDFDHMRYVKIVRGVEIPPVLTVPPDDAQARKNAPGQTYALYALVEHYGDLKHGHYTVTVQPHGDQSWYNFNDTSVTKIPDGNLTQNLSPVRSQSAYLLFYRKTGGRYDKKTGGQGAEGGPDQRGGDLRGQEESSRGGGGAVGSSSEASKLSTKDREQQAERRSLDEQLQILFEDLKKHAAESRNLSWSNRGFRGGAHSTSSPLVWTSSCSLTPRLLVISLFFLLRLFVSGLFDVPSSVLPVFLPVLRFSPIPVLADCGAFTVRVLPIVVSGSTSGLSSSILRRVITEVGSVPPSSPLTSTPPAVSTSSPRCCSLFLDSFSEAETSLIPEPKVSAAETGGINEKQINNKQKGLTQKRPNSRKTSQELMGVKRKSVRSNVESVLEKLRERSRFSGSSGNTHQHHSEHPLEEVLKEDLKLFLQRPTLRLLLPVLGAEFGDFRGGAHSTSSSSAALLLTPEVSSPLFSPCSPSFLPSNLHYSCSLHIIITLLLSVSGLFLRGGNVSDPRTQMDVQSDAGECFENILRNVSAPGVSQVQTQLFQGQLTHKTQCSKCRTLTSSEETFSSLPLSFEASNKDYKVSVVSGENQLFCERCDAKCDAATKCEIEHHPDVLLLRLRRFKFEGISNWHTRISRYVEFPYMLEIPHAGAETEIYELYAFTEHFGGYARGYHNVTIKSLDDGKWYDICGNSTRLPFKEGLSHSSWDVCLLFYRKVSIVETLGSGIRDVSASEKESRNREQQRGDDVETAGGEEVRGPAAGSQKKENEDRGGEEVRGEEGGATGGKLREEEQMKKTGGEERAGGPDQRGGDLRGQEESSRGGGGAVGSSSEASKLSTKDREQQAERRSLDEQLQILFEDLKKHAAETWNLSRSTRVDVQSGAAECFENILRNVSAPGASQLFQGQLTHKTQCSKCRTLTSSEETFSSLPLSFEDSYKDYQVSVVSGANQLFCERCAAKCDAATKCEMVNHPEVLVLRLKRFKFDSIFEWHTKIIRYVEFPCVLEIPHAGVETEIYELYAFVKHIGVYTHGYHNVTIKSLDDGKWYDISGNDVSLVNFKPFKTDENRRCRDVCLLFYRKVSAAETLGSVIRDVSASEKESRNREQQRGDDVETAGGMEGRGEEGGTRGGKLREEEQRKKTGGEQRAGTRMRTKTDLYNNPTQNRGGEAGGGARHNDGQHADSERTTVSQNGDRAKSEDGKENGKDRGGNVKEDGNKESEEEKQRYDKKMGGQGAEGGPNQRGGGAVGSSSEASKLSTTDRKQQSEAKAAASAPPPEPKYHGLYNQGATCYLNSVLQVLFMTPGFTEALHRFAKGLRSRPKPNRDPCSQPVFVSHRHPCGRPSLDKELQSLFEDLKKQTAETKNITKSLGINKVDVQSGAAECFENILRNVSAPGASQLFQGQLTHKTQCRKCRTLTSSEEPFWNLPLTFEESNKDYKVSLVSGANQLFCERCDAKCDAAAKSEMTHHPDVLMLRLGRFKFDSYYKCFKKIDRYVEFPYMLEIPHAGAETEIYELYAFVGYVVKHKYGEFFATIKPQDNEKWYNFSDHHVYVICRYKTLISNRSKWTSITVSAAEQKQTGGQGAAGGANQRGGGAVGSSSEASKLSTTVTKQQPTPVNSNLHVASKPGAGHPAASAPPPGEQNPLQAELWKPELRLTCPFFPFFPLHPEPKYHGLYNQGATCYLNSVLQVLFMTRDFREAVKRHPCGRQSLDKELQNLFEELKKQTAETRNITKSLGISRVDVQSDAAECFENILRNVSAPGASQLFQGQLRHMTKCLKCGTLTSSEEPFWNLPLELVASRSDSYSHYSVVRCLTRIWDIWDKPRLGPSGSERTDVDGIAEYFGVSEVRGSDQLFCDRCDAKTDAKMKYEIKQHPQVLMLMLKRFKFNYTYMSYVKVKNSVVIPDSVKLPGGSGAPVRLTYCLAKYSTRVCSRGRFKKGISSLCCDQSEDYELYAFVEHVGELRHGHYTATIKSQSDGNQNKENRGRNEERGGEEVRREEGGTQGGKLREEEQRKKTEGEEGAGTRMLTRADLCNNPTQSRGGEAGGGARHNDGQHADSERTTVSQNGDRVKSEDRQENGKNRGGNVKEAGNKESEEEKQRYDKKTGGQGAEGGSDLHKGGDEAKQRNERELKRAEVQGQKTEEQRGAEGGAGKDSHTSKLSMILRRRPGKAVQVSSENCQFIGSETRGDEETRYYLAPGQGNQRSGPDSGVSPQAPKPDLAGPRTAPPCRRTYSEVSQVPDKTPDDTKIQIESESSNGSAKKKEPKYHGLYNQGATCYLNSVLQVLFMTPGFREALHRFAKGLRSRPKPNRDPCSQPVFVSHRHPCGRQSLDKELQNLFEDLKKQTAETKNITKSLGISKVDVQSGAAECFENILRNVSAPGASQLFQGQLTHRTKCRKCRTLTSSEEPFLSLPLTFEESNKEYKVSVVSGANQLFCEHCDAKRDAAAKSEMTHHPDVLMLRLRRFKFNSVRREHIKIDRYVEFPYMLEIPHAGAETEIYELYAFVGNGGKYTYGQFSATIKPQDNEKWYNFSDHHVYVICRYKTLISNRSKWTTITVSAAEQKQTGGQGAAGGPNQRGGGAVGSSSEASKLSTTVTKQQPTPVNSNLQVASKPGTGRPAASAPPPEPKYHGLYNQGATCYLNSVLQVLFMTPDFREAVKRHPCGRPSLDKELQNLFEELRKQTAETRNITKSLGISRVDVQSDAAECFENILRNVSAPGASQLFQGQLTHMTQCLKCRTLTSSEEPFWNLPLELVASRSDSYSHYSVVRCLTRIWDIWDKPRLGPSGSERTDVDGIAEYFGVSEVRGSDQLFCDRCAAKTDAAM